MSGIMEKDYERILTDLPFDRSKSNQERKSLRRRGSNDAGSVGSASYSGLDLDSPANIAKVYKPDSKSVSEEEGAKVPTESQIASARSRSSSFDFEDDDDDEADLKRYNLDFSVDDHSMLANPLDGGGPAPSSSQHQLKTTDDSSTLLQFLWYSFQTQRQQARQRRAQLLLQQSDRDLRQSVWIFVMTYCDSTDTGIAVALSMIVFWAFVLSVMEDEVVKRHWLLIGCLLLAFRIGARPLWNYFLRQRLKRRQEQRQQHQQLPLSSPAAKHQALRQRVDSSDECESLPSIGRYLDEPLKNGNLELQNIPNESGDVL
jgi:hypothetical protein